jgi:hypothetical protein
MCVTVKELWEIIETDDVFHDSTWTRNAVAQSGISFRESGRFPEMISFRRIASLLSVDAKTLWNHWQQCNAWSDTWRGKKAAEFHAMRTV